MSTAGPPSFPPPPPLEPSTPQPPERERGNSLLGGIAVGVIGYLAVIGCSVVTNSGRSIEFLFSSFAYMAVFSVLVVIVATILTAAPASHRTGVGLFIGMAAGIIIDGGACIALTANP